MAKKIVVDFGSKSIILDMTPRVYLMDRTHSYLFLREKKEVGYFLTMADGSIEVVKIPREEDQFIIYRKNEGEIKDEKIRIIPYPLTPYNRDPLKAAQVYWKSTLPKSVAAERELRLILGLSPSEVSHPEESITGGKRKKSSGNGATSLADICLELGIEPSKARKLLRGKVDKPGERWEWTDQKQIEKIRGILRG